MSIARVASTVGKLVLVISCALAAPALVAAWYGETAAFWAFVCSIGVGVVLSALLQYAGRGASEAIRRREAMAIVAMAWVVCALIGCVPYLLTGTISDPVGAYFEAMSGFTTTGASVLEVVEGPVDAPYSKAILFWRCLTNWLGGVGIVVLFVALLPAIGVGGRFLFNFETPGALDKSLAFGARKTAPVLWTIYTILTLVEVGALMLAGLDGFDAICHSFSSMATGGFSPHSDSIGHYDSSAVRIIITVFMFLAGVNFTLYYQLRHGNWRAFWEDSELRAYVGILVVVTALISWDLSRAGVFDDTGDLLIAGAFSTVSIGTTTGLVTDDFNTWPAFSRFLLILLMFVGGCAGSTAGGQKVVRIMVVFKAMFHQVRRHIKPRSVDDLTIGGKSISDDVVRAVTIMFSVFVVAFGLGAASLMMMGQDMETGLTASLACIGNIGPGLGLVGPRGNYSDIPALGKIILSILMLVGRLEVFTALSLFAPRLWRD